MTTDKITAAKTAVSAAAHKSTFTPRGEKGFKKFAKPAREERFDLFTEEEDAISKRKVAPVVTDGYKITRTEATIEGSEITVETTKGSVAKGLGGLAPVKNINTRSATISTGYGTVASLLLSERDHWRVAINE